MRFYLSIPASSKGVYWPERGALIINILLAVGVSRVIHDIQGTISPRFKMFEIIIKLAGLPFPLSSSPITPGFHNCVIKLWTAFGLMEAL